MDIVNGADVRIITIPSEFAQAEVGRDQNLRLAHSNGLVVVPVAIMILLKYNTLIVNDAQTIRGLLRPTAIFGELSPRIRTRFLQRMSWEFHGLNPTRNLKAVRDRGRRQDIFGSTLEILKIRFSGMRKGI
jgi:hypothetical protein